MRKILFFLFFLITSNIVIAQDFPQLNLKELDRYPQYGIYVYESTKKFQLFESIAVFEKLALDKTGHYKEVTIFLHNKYNSISPNSSKQAIKQNIRKQQPFLTYTKTIIPRKEPLDPYIQELLILHDENKLWSRDNFTTKGTWNCSKLNY